jgi:iron(III) transport system permease protein
MRLFGNNGFFTKLLGLSTGIGGLWGIVCGSFLYAFPVAFIMFYDVFQYEDSTVYSAAETLGIGKVRAFLSLTLPYMRKSLIITTFAIFALVVTDYGVPLAVGGRYGTIPQVMYSEVIGRFNFSTGSIYALFLLVPAIVAFIADHLLTENKGGLLIRSNFILRKSTVRDVCSYILSGLLLIVALLPVITFAVIAFAKNYPNDMSLSIDSILQVSKSGAFRYLSNSIVIAFITSIVGVPLTYAIAYLVVRTEAYAGKKSKTLLSFLHLLALLSMAIPGLVLGLSFIFTYKGTLIYGTLLVLVIVNLAHFISSPYLMIYNSMRIQNENLEQVGATLGIRRWRVIVGVLIPQQKSTLFEMFAYFFVNCMITISAVSFLANSATKPISLVINVYEEQMNVGAVAVISLVILVVNLIIKGAVELTKKISEKETRRI